VKERWLKAGARFDAMSVRERVLVFAAAVLGLILAYDALVIEPLAARNKRLAAQLVEVRQGIKTSDNVIRELENLVDPDAVKRSYGAALRKQLAEIDQEMLGLQKNLVPPERMARMLEEMLASGRGLQLVALRTLPVQRFDNPVAAQAPAAAERDAKTVPAESERSIFQHSFEITFQGSYADLYEFLARLERSPWQMFWGRIALDAEYPRLRVTLTVHTLSLSKAWLVV